MAENTSLLGPGGGLIVSNPKDVTNAPEQAKQRIQAAPDYLFALQTEAWLKMQTAVSVGINLPVAVNDFTATYGAFSDTSAVKGCVDIMNTLNGSMKEYGNPVEYISHIADYEGGAEPPTIIYGHAAWLGRKTELTAETICDTYKELPKVLGEANSGERKEILKEILTGPDGIQSNAAQLHKYCADFETIVSKYYDNLNLYLFSLTPDGHTDSSYHSLKWYLAQEDNVLSEAKTAADTDTHLIQENQKKWKHLNDMYIGFIVAASAAPVLMVVPFIGPALVVADAVAFGIEAKNVKDEMDHVQEQIKEEAEDNKKKLRLVGDLTALDRTAADISMDGKAFVDAIARMSTGWADFSTHLDKIVSETQESDLDDIAAWKVRMKLDIAIEDWKKVAQAAEQFLTSGYVTWS